MYKAIHNAHENNTKHPNMTDIEDELHIPLQLPFNEQQPIVISFYEYYRFLGRLVSTVLNERIAQLMRVQMSSPIPLPRSLKKASEY